jgi:hypothetical protein
MVADVLQRMQRTLFQRVDALLGHAKVLCDRTRRQHRKIVFGGAHMGTTA